MTGPRIHASLLGVLAVLLGAFSGCFAEETKTEPSSCDSVARSALTLADRSDTVVLMETNKGCIVIELFDKKAPITVTNFIRYVNEKFFDDTCFHRIIPGFVDQGGGFDKESCNTSQKQTHAAIRLETESKLRNYEGTLSMARTSEPNSATSQFFINVANNSKGHQYDLDFDGRQAPGYAVFGNIVQGLSVAHEIEKAGTAGGTPSQLMYVKTARVLTATTPATSTPAGVPTSPSTTTAT